MGDGGEVVVLTGLEVVAVGEQARCQYPYDFAGDKPLELGRVAHLFANGDAVSALE